MRQEMTHFDEEGNARMVDVSDKDVTKRIAVAEGCIRMSEEAFQAVTEHRIAKGDVLTVAQVAVRIAKGDVLTVAQVAGISGTKKTSELIPMCHLLALTGAGITFEMEPDDCLIRVRCTVKTTGRTGVEMEALTGVSTALLTIYDMCKAIDRSMRILDIHLVEKDGGKSGHYIRKRLS